MRVLVVPHRLELGGSQVNAIDLAAALRDHHGHDVTVMATPGPALDLVLGRGLRFRPAPAGRIHPSPAVMRALRRAVRQERTDLVHAWEWPQCLDAFYGVHLTRGVPLVATNMSMGVIRFLPSNVSLTQGSVELVELARRSRRGPVTLLEPPVDAVANRPNTAGTAAFRARHSIAGIPVAVIVSRLTDWMKLESVEEAMDAVAELARRQHVQLVIVGGGPAEGRLRTRAERINRLSGESVVVLTGPMTDPRPAYDAADVVLGMGGSLLRGMAFAKPCIVLGERGYVRNLTPETVGIFLRAGFYGLGDGDREGAVRRIATDLEALLTDPARCRRLGAWGRDLVEQRFSVEAGAATLDRLYREAVERPIPVTRRAVDAIRTAVTLAATRTVPDRVRHRLIRLVEAAA